MPEQAIAAASSAPGPDEIGQRMARPACNSSLASAALADLDVRRGWQLAGVAASFKHSRAQTSGRVWQGWSAIRALHML